MLKRLLFYGAVMLQLGLLLAMVGRESFTTVWGKRIMLECVPVDPRDLFRGDYAALNYEISRLDPSLLRGIREPHEGQTVYVVLRKSGQFWSAVRAHTHPPLLSDEEVYIRGRLGKGRIVYGIERFFVPEGRARSIEAAGRSRKLSAEIALDCFGHAVLTRVFIDGQPFLVHKEAQ